MKLTEILEELLKGQMLGETITSDEGIKIEHTGASVKFSVDGETLEYLLDSRSVAT